MTTKETKEDIAVSKPAIQNAQSIDLKSLWREMEIASTSPMWEPRRMLCTQNDNIMLILLLLALMCRPGSVLYRFSFECMINFHPWSQCLVPKRVHAILQDTHIGDVNAVMLLGFSVFIRVCANETVA